MKRKPLRAVIALASLLCAGLAFGADYTTGVIGPFGGLNNSDSSLIISGPQAQDLLNVDITPGGKSVKKRKGYAQAFALGVTTNAVHGTYAFYDASGNDVSLFFNDTRLTASVAGGSATLLASTFTANQTWQCVDSQGFAYCAGTGRVRIVKTQGTTWSSLTGFPSTGTIVAVTPERLVQAGFSDFPNRIDFSKANDFTTWTVGSEPTDPITFTITTPGARITHVVYAFKKVYWFKESSFGYILEGPELSDWKIVTVSQDIGTLDNTSCQDTDGNLYFRGQDGHIYMTDGSSVVKLSRDIEETIDSAGFRITNNLEITSAADFAAGTFGLETVYVDTETVPGNIQTVFPEPFTTLRNGSNGTKSVWQEYVDSLSAGSISVSGGKLQIFSNGGFGASARTVQKIPALSPGTSFQIKIDQLPTNASGNTDFKFFLSTNTYNGAPVGNLFYTWQFNWQSTATATATLIAAANGQDSVSSLTVATTVATPFYFNVWIATNSYSYGVNGITLKQGTWFDPFGNAAKTQYAFLSYHDNTGTSTCLVDYFRVSPQTFTWTSASQSIPATITAWDTFGATKNEQSGGIAFGLRSLATSIYTNSTAGARPTINTGTYWQVRSTFSLTNIGIEDPLSLSDVSQAWNEGSASDKSYATFYEDKVMFSVAAGAGATVNNRTLVYDLIAQGWTVYDLPVNGFYRRNGRLYFGSSSAGYVYKFGDTDNDNGSAINAYWKSKDFFVENPFVDKEFVNLSLYAGVEQSTMTVTYAVDGSSETAYTVPLYKANTAFLRSNKNLTAGRVGGTINVEFGNNAADQPFEVFALSYGYRPKSWRPE